MIFIQLSINFLFIGRHLRPMWPLIETMIERLLKCNRKFTPILNVLAMLEFDRCRLDGLTYLGMSVVAHGPLPFFACRS